MKINNKDIFWIYLILISNFQSFGQCYEDFTYRTFPIIHNQPRIYLDKILEITNTDNEPNLKVDSVLLYPDSVNAYINSLNNFAMLEIDSLCFINTYLKDLTTDKLYKISTTKHFLQGNNSSVCVMLKNCFIQSYFTNKKKWETIIFNFKTLQISKSKFRLDYRRIGNDDTAIYIKQPDFKHKKKKYKNGTIVAFNENGVYIINPIFKNTKEENNNDYDFFNNSYNIKANFQYTINRNCSRDNYYKAEIKYLNEVIDTFEIEVALFWLNNFQFENDTLTIHYGGFVEFGDYRLRYRKYYKNHLIKVWFEEDFMKKYNFTNKEYSFLNFENYIIIKLVCSSSDKKHLKTINGKTYTNNNIELIETANSYQVVLMYDKQNNTFLGYPKIEFTTK